MPLDSTGEIFYPGGEQLADKNFYHIPKGSVIKYREPEWVEEAPEDDRVYGRINKFWIPLDVADVPTDDLLYARRNGVWVRVTAREVAIDDSNVDDELADRISRRGDSMLGNLALLSNPTNDLHAVNKQYVDRLLAGVPVIIGVFDASTGNCVFTPASGLADGPLPPAAPEIQGVYVIVTVAGTVPSGPVAGLSFNVGDWVFCDGITWLRLAIGNIGQLPEAPLDGGFYSRRNADWEKIFHVINATTWRIEHSLYVDAGSAANSFFRVIGGSAYFQVEARPNGQMGYSFNSYVGANRLHFMEQSVAVFDIYPQAAGCFFDKFIAGVATRLLSILETGLSIRGNLSVNSATPGGPSYSLETRGTGENVWIVNSTNNYGSRWAYRINGLNHCQVAFGQYGWNLTRIVDAEGLNRPIVNIDWNGRITVYDQGDAAEPMYPNELVRKAYVDKHSFTEAPNDTHYYARCSALWERIFSRQNINTLLMSWSLMIQDTSRTTTIFDVRNGGSIVQYNVSAGAARLTFQAPTLGATMDILLQNTAHPTWYWVIEALSQVSGTKRPGINFLKRTSSDDVILHLDEDGYVEGGRFVTNAGDPVSDNQLVRKAYVDQLYGRMVVSRFEPPTAPISTSITLHVYGINFKPNSQVVYINTTRPTTYHDSTHLSATFGTGAQPQAREVYVVTDGIPASNVVFFTPSAEGEVEVEERPVQKPVEDLTYVAKLEARLALLEVKFKELERKVYALR